MPVGPAGPAEPLGTSATCGTCGAVEEDGRWAWPETPGLRLGDATCPACERILGRRPAATIRLRGCGPSTRSAALKRLSSVECAEKAEHPQERILDVAEAGGELVVTTTGLHLARRMTSALKRALHPRVSVRFQRADDGAVILIECEETESP